MIINKSRQKYVDVGFTHDSIIYCITYKYLNISYQNIKSTHSFYLIKNIKENIKAEKIKKILFYMIVSIIIQLKMKLMY